jgi:3-methyl-2-oxobutanoate hydroxymethyltransferase
MKNKKIREIIKRKNKRPIVCLTAYSKMIAEILDKHCDIVLVGDSLGMVLYGMESTREVTLDLMINHAKSVKKGISKSVLVIDMPYQTYRNKKEAYNNAKKIIKSTKCDALKLEGGGKIINIIKYLINKNIPVMGHIGLLPQSERGKFKFKGRSLFERKRIIEDARLLSKAGVFAIVIECVEESLAEIISKSIPVPTIGIGASKYCDGQILVTDDLLGLSNFTPRFVRKYSNIKKIINESVLRFRRDVINRNFPSRKNIY